MKILMLSDLYPPVIGGGERHVESLSRELTWRGHHVTICTIGSPGLPEYEEAGDLKIYRLKGFFQKLPFLYRDTLRKWHPPTRDHLITRRLRALLATERPDIVHAHGRIIYSFLPLKEKTDVPLVTTLHSYAFFCPRTDLMRGNSVCDRPLTRDCIACGKDFYGLPKSVLTYCGTRMNRGGLRLVDKHIAPSSFTRDICARALGVGDDDILIIPDFCSADEYSRESYDINLPDDFILFVGALAPHKGLDVLIEAYRKLDTQTTLVIIGAKHPDYRYQSAEGIQVIKDAPHSVVIEAMSRCRFAIFPSICPETFGRVAIEAMSLGKAVIASGIGGLKDIVVEGETGIVVVPGDSDRLAQAISYLLRSPEIASRMGRQGLEVFMNKYSADVVVPQIVALYQSLI